MKYRAMDSKNPVEMLQWQLYDEFGPDEPTDADVPAMKQRINELMSNEMFA